MIDRGDALPRSRITVEPSSKKVEVQIGKSAYINNKLLKTNIPEDKVICLLHRIGAHLALARM
jgi:hypothetical protein